MTRAIASAMLHSPIRTVVLADDTGAALVADRGFSLPDILGWLCQPDQKTLYAWDIDQQVQGWLCDLPPEDRLALFSGVEDVQYQSPTSSSLDPPWRLSYVPSKFLQIRRGRRRWTVCDVSGYWTSSTLIGEALEEWGLPPSELPDAPERSEWRGWKLPAIGGHCRVRAEQIGALMAVVQPALKESGLGHRMPIGVGSIASRLITDGRDDHWIARYRPDRQPVIDDEPLLPHFQAAYYGGRIETTVVGSWDVTSYDYDLRSAYPWALSHLGPVGFIWEPTATFSARYEDRMSIWYVDWDVGKLPLGPFPFRHRSDAAIAYPQTGRGWYWWPEVRAALDAYGPDQIRVERGFISPESQDCPLLPMIARRFRQRARLERSHNPVAGILKRSLAAVYGKLCQSVSKGGVPGARYNLALAGWVTSAVRGRLIQAWAGSEGLVCAVSTDGILSSMPLPNVQPSDKLGGWKCETVDRVTLILPGLYRLTVNGQNGDPDQIMTAMTGIPGQIEFQWILDQLRGTKRVRVPTRTFVPHILIDGLPLYQEWERCRWRPSTTLVDPDRMLQKRALSGAVTSLDWENDHLAAPAYRSRGPGESAPHPLPPAWRDRDITLTDLAAVRARASPGR